MCGGFGGQLANTWDRTKPVEPKQLDIMDMPELLADRYGLHNMEIQQIYLLSMEPSYYARFNERLKKAKCKVTNMPLELDEPGSTYSGLIGPCSPDPAGRAKAIELTKQWIDIAAMIGCPSVMMNQGRDFTANLEASIETLKTMGAYGRTKNVVVTLENRGRTTSPEQLADLIKASGIKANPDLGNFPDEETRTRGMRLLMPLAHGNCHVKMREGMDFGRSIRLAEELGYKGVYSIEGGGPDPNVGIPKFIEALTQNM
jgi:hypothetical protein